MEGHAVHEHERRGAVAKGVIRQRRNAGAPTGLVEALADVSLVPGLPVWIEKDELERVRELVHALAVLLGADRRHGVVGEGEGSARRGALEGPEGVFLVEALELASYSELLLD